jgi:hypothetical protein
MHFKMNITEKHANFLQHILGSKTSLKNQQTHLELFSILVYAFITKTSINEKIIFITGIKSW